MLISSLVYTTDMTSGVEIAFLHALRGKMAPFPPSKCPSHQANVSGVHNTLDLILYNGKNMFLGLLELERTAGTLEHACSFVRRPVHSYSRRSTAMIQVLHHIPTLNMFMVCIRHPFELNVSSCFTMKFRSGFKRGFASLS